MLINSDLVHFLKVIEIIFDQLPSVSETLGVLKQEKAPLRCWVTLAVSATIYLNN